MAASERNILPNAEQITQGAGVDPAVHGYEGRINTSFPVRCRLLPNYKTAQFRLTSVDTYAHSWRHRTLQAITSAGLPGAHHWERFIQPHLSRLSIDVVDDLVR
jgi:hypothetical protein